MKTSHVYIAVILLVIVGVALFIFARSDGNGAQEKQSIHALVTELSDSVLLKRNAETDFTPISEPAEAQSGSVVQTGPNGRALIEVASTTHATVDFSSEFTIEHVNRKENQTRIALIAGQMWSRVEKTLEQGEFYEIETQNGVATVRGTSFNVSFEAGETRVDVADGEVRIAKRDPETGDVLPDTEETVSPGKSARIVGDEPISVIDTPQEVLESDWFTQNTEQSDSDNTGAETDQQSQQSQTQEPAQDTNTESTSEQTPQDTQPEQNETTTENIERQQGVFAITDMSTTKLTLENGKSSTISLFGSGLKDAAVVVIGQYSIENFEIVSDSQINVTVPFEIPDGSYKIFVFGSGGEAQIATAPEELSVSHRTDPDANDGERQG